MNHQHFHFAYPLATPEIEGQLLAWRGDPAAACDRLCELGYTAIEPFVRDPAAFDENAFERAVTSSGLKVAAVGTGPVAVHDGLTFTHHKPEIRQQAVDRTRRVIDFAARFGAQVNVGKLRGNIGRERQEETCQWRDAAFRSICEHADAAKLCVTLEPQNRFIIDNLNTTHESLEWIEKMQIHNLKIMLDTFHMLIEDSSAVASIVQARNLLLHIHFADIRRMAPGCGSIDFRTILHVLHALPYSDYISVEVIQYPDQDTIAAKAISQLKQLLQTLHP